MDIKELLLFRDQLLGNSRDEHGYISEDGILDNCLSALNDTKYIDSTDYNRTYDMLENGALKINGYLINESGERLQLFIVNEDSLALGAQESQLLIAQRAYYEKQMSRALNMVKKSVKKQLMEQLHDGSPAWILVRQLSEPDFLDQIDVVEIFLISATATIESRGTAPTAKMLEFDDDTVTVSFVRNNKKETREVKIIRRLIDLNFLYNVQIAEGSRYPLIIDFTEPPFHPIPLLHAAGEADFDSYLCALPATLLAELYKKHSSRLLEKNVRSFLQLKGVNKGMQETIRTEPEKFIAYNNGLTITATGGELIDHKGQRCIKTLSDFQIVNGGQTTATIYFSRKAGLSVDSIQVMAKINVAKNASEDMLDELISKISMYSNAQSKVSKVDLRARSTQLVKLKSLSESVLTVSGKKWFFERAKGEYTTMVRVNSAKKTQLEKTYPRERRFTKEELAKYYSAWDNKPYAVKKGGEKIFRLFLEEISGEGRNKKPLTINRSFYEDLIARIILFRSLEKNYGQGPGAIGQLRSAVVPYAISAVYEFTGGGKKNSRFDLLRIWKTEKLDDELMTFFRELMLLINDLIKTYSRSDDLGEYSKKPELWADIVASAELTGFMNRADNSQLLEKYTVAPEEQKRREKEAAQTEDLDFEPFLYAAEMYDRGPEFYTRLINQTSFDLSDSQQYKLGEILAAIRQNKDIGPGHIEFEKQLLRQVLLHSPGSLPKDSNTDLMRRTALLIIKRYNSALNAGAAPIGEFTALQELARKKGVPFYSVFSEIGKNLRNQTLPTMSQLVQATEYLKKIEPAAS